MNVTWADLDAARAEDAWSVGNDVLYQMCRDYPSHREHLEITAKVWLIGRAYSASVERGRSRGNAAAASNDEFYTRNLPKALQQSDLDDKLTRVRRFTQLSTRAIAPALSAHRRLVSLFRELTGLEKRSLASKYLHFHCPDVFFIYDERAVGVLREVVPPVARHFPGGRVDHPYADFMAGALWLTEQLHCEFGHRLSPRQLDRLLLRLDTKR